MNINNTKLFLSFNNFMQSIFGERVYKVSIDADFTCPNRDGTKGSSGCIYCDNYGSSSRVDDGNLNINKGKKESITDQIQRNIKIRAKQQALPRKYLAYFQSYSNTYSTVEKLKCMYDEAINAHNDVVGISISTRADCIDEEKLKLINSYTLKLPFVSIEYGMQSIYDKSLNFYERKEKHQDFIEALKLTQKYPKIHVCVHVILGSFIESRDEILDMAKYLSDLNINGVKLHILTILQKTKLSEIVNIDKNEITYNENRNKEKFNFSFNNHLSSLEDAVSLISDFVERLSPQIVIHKVAGYGHINDILYPDWIKDHKDRILINVKKELLRRKSFQGKL